VRYQGLHNIYEVENVKAIDIKTGNRDKKISEHFKDVNFFQLKI